MKKKNILLLLLLLLTIILLTNCTTYKKWERKGIIKGWLDTSSTKSSTFIKLHNALDTNVIDKSVDSLFDEHFDNDQIHDTVYIEKLKIKYKYKENLKKDIKKIIENNVKKAYIQLDTILNVNKDLKIKVKTVNNNLVFEVIKNKTTIVKQKDKKEWINYVLLGVNILLLLLLLLLVIKLIIFARS